MSEDRKPTSWTDVVGILGFCVIILGFCGWLAWLVLG